MCYAWCLAKMEPNTNECIQCFYANSFILIMHLFSHYGLNFRDLLQLSP
jgi:hypothetical protein